MMEIIPLEGLPPFPASPPLDPDKLTELENVLRKLADGAIERHLPITGFDTPHADEIRARLRALAEPLTAYLPPQVRAPLFKQRSGNEAAICDSQEPMACAIFANPPEFKARLRQIASAVHLTDMAFRTTPISTEPGYGGNVIAYPPAALVDDLLEAVCVEISRHPDAAICQTAAYAMLACATIHPFIDGNGRTVRILFNLLLQSKHPGLPYIGINEVTLFAAGDFLIATNRVQFQRDWDCYFSWLQAICELHLSMQSRRAVGS